MSKLILIFNDNIIEQVKEKCKDQKELLADILKITDEKKEQLKNVFNKTKENKPKEEDLDVDKILPKEEKPEEEEKKEEEVKAPEEEA